MSAEETSPISHLPSPISSLARPPTTEWRAGVLVGPTAVGKSAVAQWLAERLGVPILSADSMLVYRGMDIGTAKPTPAERGAVPYFGIDCVDPGTPFSAGAWLSFARRQLAEHKGIENVKSKIENCNGAGHSQSSILNSQFPSLIVTGGTGLYVRALLCGLDAPPSDGAARARWAAVFESGGLASLRVAVDANPVARALLSDGDLANPRRLIRALERAEAGEKPALAPCSEAPGKDAFGQAVAGLTMPRDRLASRIMSRIDKMFKDGLVEEAVALRDASGGLSSTACGAIGYAEALAVADGLLTRPEAAERIAARTRQLAKRQFTWFRHQLRVDWIEVADDDTPATLGPKVLEIWKRNGCCIIEN